MLMESYWHPEFGKSISNFCLKINLLSDDYEMLITCRNMGS